MTNFVVEPREKYALIAIPQAFVDDGIPDEQHVAPDLWVARKLPFPLDDLWTRWIGTIQTEEFEESNLVLLTKGPSANPEVVDQENERYLTHVHQFYYGLLLSGFLRCLGQPRQLSGANTDGKIDVRQLGEVKTPIFVPGSPLDPVDTFRLENAGKLAYAIRKLPRKAKFDRFGRILHTFYAGVTSEDAGNKLHQFVRCVEGFIYPDPGETKSQFRSRTELFLGPRHHTLAGEFYDIRSSVEHLHSPSRTIRAQTEREKRLIVLQRAVEAEALARHCIGTLLLNQSLWPQFEEDESLAKFWTLPVDTRRKLWGHPLDIDSISKAFDPRFIEDADLGL